MTINAVQSYVEGQWYFGSGPTTTIFSAITGEVIATASSGGIDFGSMARFGRLRGGPALRALTFHQRAGLLKALGQAIIDRKEELYELSYNTGATRADSWIDIEGGAGTFLAYANKGKRELPNTSHIIDGELEILSKSGKFVGQHVYTSLQGIAVHINAFNFPVWGMLEKLAPCLLAGVPAIIKPATSTCYLAAAAFRILIESGHLPDGAIQFIAGSPGDIIDFLGGQDAISFTGSAETSNILQRHPTVAREAVRFSAERDSLNASILGPDATEQSPEFELFLTELVREMTVKAGQKCTAIRRALVPKALIGSVQNALSEKLGALRIGDPRDENTQMGSLVSQEQCNQVRRTVLELSKSAQIIYGDPNAVFPSTDDLSGGAFFSPILLRTDNPGTADSVHELEAFGPVATLMPYTDSLEAINTVNLGKGSLALSVFTHSKEFARDITFGSGSYNGRLAFINRYCAKDSTGHGSPLPVLVHGGPGRAGGGEEMGGLRGVKHYMQRSALQGDPTMLSSILGQYLTGADQVLAEIHPFRLRLGELVPGYTFKTNSRLVTLEDIEHFAHFTGDTFYAHMDEVAAAASPIFGGRVAHGYLILSFAAGLFVDPAPGPVLANFGLEGLRFVKPLKPGDSMKVALTVRSTSLRSPDMGEARWAVSVSNQRDEPVATYDLLTMNAV
jgi:oxepin-CoA hydrolase/3-oxo-5,6-dehydrosuberyl-CoA semialdehyde dehydrogenase